MKKVCSLDVHKDTIFCARYNGERYSEVKEYKTTTGSIYSMTKTHPFLRYNRMLYQTSSVAYALSHQEYVD
jgi:hypothetical protein